MQCLGDRIRELEKLQHLQETQPEPDEAQRLRYRVRELENLQHLQDRVRELEDRVRGIEHAGSRRSSFSSGTSSSGASDNNSESNSKTKDENSLHGRRTISEVKECNWEQFKNRFGTHDRDYAIECLLAGANLKYEIAHEQRKRHVSEETISMADEKDKNALPRVRLDKAWGDLMQKTDTNKDVEKRWLQRVRVNSVPVLKRWER